MPERKLPKEGTCDEMVKSHAIDDATIRAPTKPHPTGISVTEDPYYAEDVVRQEASELCLGRSGFFNKNCKKLVVCYFLFNAIILIK